MGGDFTLNESSPCLPPNSGPCGLIGALGQGCATVSAGERLTVESWARIKDRYR